MKRIQLFLILFLMLPAHLVYAQNDIELTISSPGEGQIVQGLVVINGNVTVLGFSSYELSFAYESDPTQTWFLLHTSTSPVFEGELGTWDTTTLTDGDYNLRIKASLLNGSTQEMIVSGLQVRNYTSVPTPTPAPTTTAISQFAPPTAQLLLTAPATVTHSFPTPTSLAANPAELGMPSISSALIKGALIALLVFFGTGFIFRVRRE